jgi:hypothetical protein
MRWVLHNVMCTKMLDSELYAHRGTIGDMMTYIIWWLSSCNIWGQWHRLRLLLGFMGDPSSFVCFVDSCVYFSDDLPLICSMWFYEKFIYPMDVSRQGLLVMTLIEELSMTIARDFGSRWILLNMIRIPYACCITDRSPNGLRHVKRARCSTSTTLFCVRQERELFAPLYSLR